MEPLRSRDPTRIGRYRLLMRLGQGGMGIVYLAQAGDLLVALKTIHPHLADEPSFRRRFTREIENAKRVEHSNIVKILDAEGDAETPWYAAEHVSDAIQLDSLVAITGPVSQSVLVRLSTQLAECIGAIHSKGLIHRDLKPSNILARGDQFIIIDFGISRLIADAGTHQSTAILSYGWAAPEQYDGPTQQTQQVDVFLWALVVGYAALGRTLLVETGGMPSQEVAFRRTVRGEFFLDGLPLWLLPLVQECLALAPEDRPEMADVWYACAVKGDETGDLPRELDSTPVSSGQETGGPGANRGQDRVVVGGRAAVPIEVTKSLQEGVLLLLPRLAPGESPATIIDAFLALPTGNAFANELADGSLVLEGSEGRFLLPARELSDLWGTAHEAPADHMGRVLEVFAKVGVDRMTAGSLHWLYSTQGFSDFYRSTTRFIWYNKPPPANDQGWVPLAEFLSRGERMGTWSHDQVRRHYPNSGRRWTAGQLRAARAGANEELSLWSMSKLLGRSPSAICTKLRSEGMLSQAWPHAGDGASAQHTST
jgi:hypothetical protein